MQMRPVTVDKQSAMRGKRVMSISTCARDSFTSTVIRDLLETKRSHRAVAMSEAVRVQTPDVPSTVTYLFAAEISFGADTVRVTVNGSAYLTDSTYWF